MSVTLTISEFYEHESCGKCTVASYKAATDLRSVPALQGVT